MGRRLLALSCLSFLSIFTIIISTSTNHVGVAMALPLSTNTRWVVDQNGERVKLGCVNWASHLEPMVAEGLSKQPIDSIVERIVSMGFNCVRLTWPIYLVTNRILGSLTVRQSFQNLGLAQYISGILANNTGIIDASLIQAFQEVVHGLGRQNVMVILDNHVSKPGWCCSDSDGNGFFNDKHFDVDLWLQGLSNMATLFNGVANVVAMSLRNELRGHKQNVPDWFRYMQKGAEAVHASNPNVLIILSGLNYDLDLSFLQNHSLTLTFANKLVFEEHWYSFSDGSNIWQDQNLNQVCAKVKNRINTSSGFLTDGYPLFFSEFGVDQSGQNLNDNRFFSCFISLAAELDFDWALWTLVGSYYVRDGVAGYNESYGLLNSDWSGSKNSRFLQVLSSIQSPFQGPSLSARNQHKVMFHPLTGQCVIRKSPVGPLTLGSCPESEAWDYTPEQQIMMSLNGTIACLRAEELGEPANLSSICNNSSSSKWEMISDSKLHISTNITGTSVSVCLDVDVSNNTIITNSCTCLSGDRSCDPRSQWFKLINNTRI